MANGLMNKIVYQTNEGLFYVDPEGNKTVKWDNLFWVQIHDGSEEMLACKLSPESDVVGEPTRCTPSTYTELSPDRAPHTALLVAAMWPNTKQLASFKLDACVAYNRKTKEDS
jgi:hypothetical protein